MAKGIRITSNVDGFRRGGIAHAKGATDHALDKFTKEQLAQLRAEPNLVVEDVELEEPKKAKGGNRAASEIAS